MTKDIHLSTDFVYHEYERIFSSISFWSFWIYLFLQLSMKLTQCYFKPWVLTLVLYSSSYQVSFLVSDGMDGRDLPPSVPTLLLSEMLVEQTITMKNVILTSLRPHIWIFNCYINDIYVKKFMQKYTQLVCKMLFYN